MRSFKTTLLMVMLRTLNKPLVVVLELYKTLLVLPLLNNKSLEETTSSPFLGMPTLCTLVGRAVVVVGIILSKSSRPHKAPHHNDLRWWLLDSFSTMSSKDLELMCTLLCQLWLTPTDARDAVVMQVLARRSLALLFFSFLFFVFLFCPQLKV